MKRLTPLLLAVLCFACGSKEKKIKQNTTPKKDIHARNAAPAFNYGNTVLLQYDRYLNQLDTESVQSGYQAAETFQKLFKTQQAAVCDTAYHIFNQFHSLLCSYLNEHMASDSINYEQMIYGDENGHKPVLSKKQKAIARALEKNGFGIDAEEGTAFIVQNQQFILQVFNKYVSAPMKQYLTQFKKEQEEGYQEDAGLTISPNQLADRVVWWEQFSKSNPKFMYATECGMNYKYLMAVLLHGMDNTSVREYTSDNTDSLSDYFHTAYTYVQSKYAQSNTNKVVTPYFNAWLKKDTAEVSRILNNFKEENGIVY